MPPQEPKNRDPQADLFLVELGKIIDPGHGLVRMSREIRWEEFEGRMSVQFCTDNGRRAASTRLMVGLHYLKHAFDLSDEGVLEGWRENPYWQYFCGEKHFQHELPIDATTMVRWRGRIKEAGMEQMLGETIRSGLKSGMIRSKTLERVNVDTTVQEKHIRFPTDARLYDRMRQKLVGQARRDGVSLRQSYSRVGRRLLMQQSRYAHAQQFKRARKMTGRLKTLLGRVFRDIQRRQCHPRGRMKELLGLSQRLLKQQREDRHKLYSIHEPDVECIAKGKIHKRYEFGCKVSLVSASGSNWVLAIRALHGNPYDGHTLKAAIDQAHQLSGVRPSMAFCDLGYRGHDTVKNCQIHVVPRRRRHLSASLRHWMNRRSAIEPIIGHLKTENRLQRNRLKAQQGDRINALLSACGFNFRKLLRAFFCPHLPASFQAFCRSFNIHLSAFNPTAFA